MIGITFLLRLLSFLVFTVIFLAILTVVFWGISRAVRYAVDVNLLELRTATEWARERMPKFRLGRKKRKK